MACRPPAADLAQRGAVRLRLARYPALQQAAGLSRRADPRRAAGPKRPHLAIEAPCGIVAISCNYATTDWLTRGAVAEFSATCVLPWLFACFAWLRAGRPRLAIGPLMWLLWLAHGAIATFASVLLGPCVAVAAVVHGRGVVRAVPRLLAGIGIFAAWRCPGRSRRCR